MSDSVSNNSKGSNTPSSSINKGFWSKRFLVSGGTGLIGQALTRKIEDHGGSLTILTRKPSKDCEPRSCLTYIAQLSELNSDAEFDVVINLAGESIAAGRWSASRKQQLLDSRINTTAGLVKWVAEATHKPEAFLSASAIGFYGDHGLTSIDEVSAAKPCFSSELCRCWEAAALQAQVLGVDTYLMRFGVVISEHGGTLNELCKAVSLKTVPQFGSGRQWFSWVDINDALNAMAAMVDKRLLGPVNVVAPEPVTNGELVKTLADQLRCWFTPAVPAFVLHATMGQMADELLLASQRVLPKRLLDAGFVFQSPTIAQSLERVLAEKG